MLLSLERFVSIFLPILSKTWTTRKKVIIILITVGLLLGAVNLHHLWTYDLKPRYFSPTCLQVLVNTSKIIWTVKLHDLVLNDIKSYHSMKFLMMNEKHYYYPTFSTRSRSGCSTVKKYSVFLSEYWPWLNLAIYSIVPLSVMIATSIAIIAKLLYSQ